MSWARVLFHWAVAAALGLAFFASGRARDGEIAPGSARDGGRPVATPTPSASPRVDAARSADGGDTRAAATPIADLPAGAASWIRVERGSRAVAWRRGPDGSWKVEFPTGKSIPPGLLSAFADQLDVVREGERIDAAGPDADFGIDHPSMRIEWEGAGGSRGDLRVGDRTPAGTAWYARSGAGGAAGTVRIVGANLVYYADLVLDAAR
ncbi:MAG: DUF4340 domain-containing protein [Alphaproteobacteria bacterium]